MMKQAYIIQGGHQEQDDGGDVQEDYPGQDQHDGSLNTDNTIQRMGCGLFM